MSRHVYAISIPSLRSTVEPSSNAETSGSRTNPTVTPCTKSSNKTRTYKRFLSSRRFIRIRSHERMALSNTASLTCVTSRRKSIRSLPSSESTLPHKKSSAPIRVGYLANELCRKNCSSLHYKDKAPRNGNPDVRSFVHSTFRPVIKCLNFSFVVLNRCNIAPCCLICCSTK